MLEHWLFQIPLDPCKDVEDLNVFPLEKRIQYANGIVDRHHLPMSFTPLQLCVSWQTKSKQVVHRAVQSLILSGADVNYLSSRGHNSVHLLIMMCFHTPRPAIILQRLEWLLTKGVNINTPCVVKLISDSSSSSSLHVVQPLDLFMEMFDQRLSFCPQYHFPSYLTIEPFRKLSEVMLQKFLILFLFYGANALRVENVTRINTLLSVLSSKHVSILYPLLWRDFMTVRYKLPPGLATQEIAKRVSFLQKKKKYVDHHWILQERESLYYASKTCQYLNPSLEEYAEFLPYEYVQYTEKNGHRFCFHKTLLPHIFQSHLNPLTRSEIPTPVLQQWFSEWSKHPLHFHRIFLLREILEEGEEDCFLKTTTCHENDVYFSTIFLFQHIHSLLSFHFPYSNWLKVLSLSLAELQFVAHLLISEPCVFIQYKKVCFSNIDQARFEFAVVTFNSIIHNDFPMETFFFGIENALQDISCFHLIRKFLEDHQEKLSRENFLDMILRYPQVGDVLRDRLGYVHLGYFFEIWQRLMIFQDNFL